MRISLILANSTIDVFVKFVKISEIRVYSALHALNWRHETKKITKFARFFRIDTEWTINS